MIRVLLRPLDLLESFCRLIYFMNMRRLEADQKAMILVFRDFNFGSQIFIKVLAIFLIVPDRDLLHSTTFFM